VGTRGILNSHKINEQVTLKDGFSFVMMGNDCSSQESKCSVCNSTEIVVLIELEQVPVHCNLLWPTREAALQTPRGDMQLGFCRNCSYIFNLAFKPELMEYSQTYENSLHFSPRFQSYAESLATYLIDRYELRDKDIIEIGCGQGDFLRLLCELGNNRGVGFDPSYVPGQNHEATARLTFIQDLYSERYTAYHADLICCRHVLEHIQFPRDFVGRVRRSIGDRSSTVVFFEVPNVLFTLQDLGIWDLIYEHCSYFSPSSLAHLFTLCGFNDYNLSETYAGQFLCIEAIPGEGSSGLADSKNNLKMMANDVNAFADNYRRTVESWRYKLDQMAASGQKTVVWGSGSKGVTFLNMLKTQDQIEYVVDINPRKHGMYVAGTGQQIVPPEFLQNYLPDVVIIMNPIYQDEIRQITEKLDLSPQLICVQAEGG